MKTLKGLLATTLLATTALAGAAAAQDKPKVAVDLTTLTSPFWTSYNKYIVEEAEGPGHRPARAVQLGVRTAKQITGVRTPSPWAPRASSSRPSTPRPPAPC